MNRALFTVTAALTLLAMTAMTAQAAIITINFKSGTLYKSDGTPLDKGSALIVLADNDKDGFDDVDFANGLASSIAPAGTTLVKHSETNDLLTTGGFTGSKVASWSEQVSFNTGSLQTDTPLAFLWFDTPFNASQSINGFGAGIDFGVFIGDPNTGDIQDDENPEVGYDLATAGTIDRNYFVDNVGENEVPVGYDFAALEGRAGADSDNTVEEGPAFGDTTVPEPATLALLGLGGLMIVRRRR